MGVTALAAAVGVGTGYQIYSGQQAAKAQEDALNQAKDQQAKAEQQADQAMNAANPKKPDTAANVSALQQAAKAGASGTMLTGPSGIDPSTLNLGKTTLLGA